MRNLIAQYRKLLHWLRSQLVWGESFVEIGVFVLGALLVPSSKFFFFWTALWVCWFVLRRRELSVAVILATSIVSLFHLGQPYVFPVFSARELMNPAYPEGRNLYFKLTPALFLGLPMALAYVREIWLHRGQKVTQKVWMVGVELSVWLLVLTRMWSSVQSLLFPDISFTYILGFFVVSLLIALGNRFVFYRPVSLTRRLLRTLILCLVGMMVLQSAITIGQFWKRGVIGLKVEQSDVLVVSSGSLEESNAFVRPIGLADHANSNAASLLKGIAICLLGLAIPWNSKGMKKVLQVCFTVGVVGLLLTQSRAGYAGFIVLSLGAIYTYRTSLVRNWKQVQISLQQHALTVLALCILVALIFPSRVLHTLYSFSESGGVGVRANLITQATELWKKFPVFGVGTGMFIPAMKEYGSDPTYRYFPESVHNGLLLFVVENGVVGLLVFTFVLFWIYQGLRSLRFDHPKNTGLLISFVSAYLVLLFFHPIPDILPLEVFMFIWVMYVEKTA